MNFQPLLSVRNICSKKHSSIKNYNYYNPYSTLKLLTNWSITNSLFNNNSLNIIDFLAPIKNNYAIKLNRENEDILAENYEFLSKYFNITTEKEYHQVISRIEDKHIYGLNGTLDLLDFYFKQYKFWTLYDPNILCENLKPTIKMLSPLGKCHTYLMGKNNNETFVDKIKLYTGDQRGELSTCLIRKYFLHPSNHLPIWTSNQFRATDVSIKQKLSFIVRMRTIQMNKLPPPYDKKCNIYSEKQQFDCMNECIEKYYNDKLKCYPNKDNYYTIMVDEQILSKNFIFCNESEKVSEASNYFALTCQSKCGQPCSIIYYDQDLIPAKMLEEFDFTEPKYIEFIFDSIDYLKIIWLPQFTMVSLFIKIVNIWSLWNGINLKKLIDLIIENLTLIYSFIFNKIVNKININTNWKNYFNYEITKVRFFSIIYQIFKY